jgi:hypothetical protein
MLFAAAEAFRRNVSTVFLTTGVAFILVIVLAGCGGASGENGGSASGDRIRVRLDKSQAGQLLRYYFGGYTTPQGADPFRRGLLSERDGRYFVNLDSMAGRHPKIARKLRQAAGGNALNWDELAAFLQQTYYDTRDVPATRAKLLDQLKWPSDSSAWFGVEVDGVMTSARRRVRVREAALRHALTRYQENDEELIYPDSTTIIGGHYQDGELAETTVMRKRADGFWDFFTYGPNGKLAAETSTPPRVLKSPTECVGCHMGTRGFEPEESFPAEAPPGPHGPRAVHVGERMRDAEVVRFFQEHARRSDMVLGLYNTLFVSKLRAERRDGTIAPKDRKLLSNLGL